MTENRMTTPTAAGARPAPVMPPDALSASTPEEVTAYAARRFGWNRLRMRAVDRSVSALGELSYRLIEPEREGLRAWVTATDDRIGHADYATEQDPEGFAYVAREVTALDDPELLSRYADRLRAVANARYLVRAVGEVAPLKRARLAQSYEQAAERYADDPDSKRGAEHRTAADAIRRGSGYVLWDRVNHFYAVVPWRLTAKEIEVVSDRKNRQHEQLFGADLWR